MGISVVFQLLVQYVIVGSDHPAKNRGDHFADVESEESGIPGAANLFSFPMSPKRMRAVLNNPYLVPYPVFSLSHNFI